jgi:hypothetical protein
MLRQEPKVRLSVLEDVGNLGRGEHHDADTPHTRESKRTEESGVRLPQVRDVEHDALCG